MFLGTEATYELTRLSEAGPAVTHDEWVRGGVWARGEGYAHAIIGDLLAGSAGWIDWNLLLDSEGGPNHLGNMCDAPMVADRASGQVHLHPQFYFLGHFSRFVPPGAVRVQLERSASASRYGAQPADEPATSVDGVYNLSGAVAYGGCPRGAPRAVALKRPEDGQLVVIVLNCDAAPAVVRVVLGASGRALQQTIPPHAIHTYVIAPTVNAE